MTVPGMAKLTIVTNSNAVRPTKRCRTRTYAVRSPSAAVIGAAIEASSIVVQKDRQAAPDQMIPVPPHSTENALA